MNLYVKVLTAKYYYVSKTNKLRSEIAVISCISIFHSLNIFSVLRLFGVNILDFEKEIFLTFSTSIYVVICSMHHIFLFRKKSLNDRLELIDKNNCRNYDYFHLLYELITVVLLFYVFRINWANYFFVLLFLVGFNLIHHAIISIKDEN